MRDLSSLPNLSVALVQTTLAWQDRLANYEHFETLMEQARGSDLIVLPEMFTTGFSMDSERLAEPENGPTYKWLKSQAKKLNAVITGSVIIQAADGSHRNRLLWARPDGEILHYDKRHLFRMAGEHKHYTPGERQVQFEINGWRVRPLICYDLRFPVWSRDPQDTDLLLYTRQLAGSTASALEPFVTGSRYREPLLCGRGEPGGYRRQRLCLHGRQPGAGFPG